MTYERITGTQRVVQKRRPWTKEENELLRKTVEELGTKDWTEIAKEIPDRAAKQCREHWSMYLDPNLNKNPWTPEEDRIIKERQKKIGNQWKKIAPLLPGRSDYMVRNRWYNVLQKQKETQDPQGQPNIKKPLRRACIYLPKALQNPQVQPAIHHQQPPQLGQGYPGQGYPGQGYLGQPTIHQQPLQNPQKNQLPKITEISDSLHIASEDIDTFLSNFTLNKQRQQRGS